MRTIIVNTGGPRGPQGNQGPSGSQGIPGENIDTGSLGSTNIIGSLTASLNISSSNTIIGLTGSFSHLQGNSPITVGSPVNFLFPITASNIVTNNNTGSFVTNLQTSSMSVLTASFAATASHLLNNPPSFPFTGSAEITGSLIVTGPITNQGTTRTLFTTASIVYSGSNVTQVTQSFGSTQQITNIVYSGSFADGNPLSIAVTGSDGVNKLYTLTYSASLVTQIIQS
tara:strand:+ start:654 stop:1334 length:681 start_codon:yes stop_codon:yes gene_type:complete